MHDRALTTTARLIMSVMYNMITRYTLVFISGTWQGKYIFRDAGDSA